ncbi:hypothetical protein ABW19_dt0204656 [Dactylella cylindrospora]|nr:hypothetical protein ABW19_dt0204656 [Dactylella cylindrospora]
MSGYPYGYGGMGGGPPPPPPPPQSPGYRQGIRQSYYTQETAESPGWRVPYQETEVMITTVDATPPSATSPGGYNSNPSRSSSIRRPENHAVDRDRFYNNNVTETQESTPTSHNMAIEERNITENEQVSDGLSEGLNFLGWGVGHYDISKPNYTPSTAPPQSSSNQPTTMHEYEPAYEKISMDYYDHFTPSFQPAAPPPQPQSQPQPSRPQYEYDSAPRPTVPHLAVSDPFPISVDQERFSSEQADLRESQFPEPVNLGGSDLLFQPPSRSYTSYRRTPRRQQEDPIPVQLDANGLPSLNNLYGNNPATSPQSAPAGGRNSFAFEDEKRFYPPNYNNSSISLLSTKSDNFSQSYLDRKPSYASIRPDIDPRPDVKGSLNIPPPPTGPVRYSSQRVGVSKLGQIMQEKKMEYVVNEINRKDELHKQIAEESRRWAGV